MKTIRITKGYSVIIDDEDFESVSRHSWCALVLPGDKIYAKRGTGNGANQRVILMHRQLMGANDRRTLVDHVNGDGLDNRRENMRLASRSQNAQNQRTKARGKTSQYKGVHWWKARAVWRASIKLDGKDRILGTFGDELEAALAYDAAARSLFGGFAAPNFQVPRS